MLTPKIKQAVLIGAFALLAVVAALGWSRDNRVSPSTSYLTPQGVYGAQPVSPVVGGADQRSTYGYPAQAGQQAVYAPDYALATPAAVNCVEPEYDDRVSYARPVQTRYRTYDRPRVVRQVAYDEAPERVVVERQRRKRSTGKSVAIVAGSAGVGAGIGALAGGGKGAALGALTGGTAGFIYDRLTHSK